MEIISYNLNLVDHEDYYLKIRKFTSGIVKESKVAIGDVIFDFQKFLFENPPKNLYINEDFKEDYNFEEHVFELLFLGIMWKNYIKVAINLDSFYQGILAKLVDLRNQKYIINLEENGNIHLKEKLDEIRGLLATKHLLTEDIKDIINTNQYPVDQYLISNENQINFSIKNLNLLLNYLKATGDYEESFKHLLLWKQFLSRKSGDEIDYYFKNILSFTNWFEKIANEELYGYTVNIDNFRKNQLQNHIDNEDIIFCARDKSEYYLNMFGAEVMNRVFRYEFEKRDRIAIILPTCMKLEDFSGLNQCMVVQDHLGLKCAFCNDECKIGRVSKIINEEYNNYNIDVYISAHNSSILSNITKKDEEELAIVGVACINNLIEGGWKISSSRIPAQCVILDYVGCRKHWDEKGFPTDFNLDELDRIITFNTSSL